MSAVSRTLLCYVCIPSGKECQKSLAGEEGMAAVDHEEKPFADQERGDYPNIPAPGSGLRALLSGLKGPASDLKTPARVERAATAGLDFLSFDTPSAKSDGVGAKRKRAEEDNQGLDGTLNFLSFGDPKKGSKEGKKEGKFVESPAARAPPDDSVYNKKSPWSRGRVYQISGRDRTVSLHHEIMDFVEFIQPVRAETKKRDELVVHLRAITEQLWPGARLEVFGSCVTGLQLPCR